MHEVKVGMITIIRLENLIGPVQDWPRRETDRTKLNEINAERGGDEVFFLHGREVCGSAKHEVISLRGKTIEGWVASALILWLQIGWMSELVRVIEPDTATGQKAPKIKLQFKWWYPNMDTTGELSAHNWLTVVRGLADKRLNIRNVFLNECDGEQFASIILGPDFVHGAPAPVRFDYRDHTLYLSYEE